MDPKRTEEIPAALVIGLPDGLRHRTILSGTALTGGSAVPEAAAPELPQPTPAPPPPPAPAKAAAGYRPARLQAGPREYTGHSEDHHRQHPTKQWLRAAPQPNQGCRSGGLGTDRHHGDPTGHGRPCLQATTTKQHIGIHLTQARRHCSPRLSAPSPSSRRSIHSPPQGTGRSPG